MTNVELFARALQGSWLNLSEASQLFYTSGLAEIMAIAHEIRMKLHPKSEVSWIIDRNVNITNVCISGCKFCNFHCRPGKDEAFITTLDEYRLKIAELKQLGGNQLLLQGGLHPKLGLDFYTGLFKSLKTEFPDVKLHALGPPEIAHIARLERKSHREVLEALVHSGLDSLPGAGAEILSDRVRKTISPGKCNTQTWLDVMREAHKMNMLTSATMMMGHIETLEERIGHLLLLRQLQEERPAGHTGFISFIPWPFQDKNTKLRIESGIVNSVTISEYVRFIALSRILLPNISNIQASWLTVGIPAGQLCLHGGANDFGSIMIEENVVSSAGASYKTDADGIQKAIKDAGFIPRQRNQRFEFLNEIEIEQ